MLASETEECLEIVQQKYNQLILTKVHKYFNEGRTALSTNGTRTFRHSQAKKRDLDLNFISYTKINLNKIMKLNSKHKTIKIRRKYQRKSS